MSTRIGYKSFKYPTVYPTVCSDGTYVFCPTFFKCVKCAESAERNVGYTQYSNPNSFATFAITGAIFG